MRIAMTGATGFVGSALGSALRERGDEVVAFRHGQPDNPDELTRWSVSDGFAPRAFSGFDAVVHLAGESVAARWTAEKKQAIRGSRVQGTARVVEALQRAEPRPRVFVCASAVGFYGDRGDELLDEHSDPGDDFLASVVEEWERAARAATSIAGVRVVLARFGLVLGRQGGTLPKLLLPFRLGIGGRVASGQQFMAWVHIEDLVAALLHLLDGDAAQGVYNVTAPEPVRNDVFTQRLAAHVHRPAFLPLPERALKVALGEMSQLLLASQRVLPKRLLADGHRFRFGTLEAALADLL